jgi:aspartate/methionine/tyrosine aminotransferase
MPRIMARPFKSSRRLPGIAPNAISRTLEAMRAGGTPVIDLTESNPTHSGLAYPRDLLTPLGHPRGLSYDPDPLGARAAREAITAACRRRGADIDPDCVVLSASTSEAYSWLFKLLCDPGESVLAPRPSYPLFEHLTRLEGVTTAFYDLEYHQRWDIDFASVEAAPPDTRAILVVSPNNPTGSYVSRTEIDRLTNICRDRSWALVVDEVFADYPLDEASPITDLATGNEVLTFTLGGASKSVGLPQVKLGWLIVGGPEDARRQALAALEVIADTFLSVGTPVQAAAPELLAAGHVVREDIHKRVRANLRQARLLVRSHPASEVLRVEGGWFIVLRVPSRCSEEQLVLDLLQGERVLVHPGYFFDFARESFLVASLLPQEDAFADGIERVLRFVS